MVSQAIPDQKKWASITSLAGSLGLPVATVASWNRRGIPAKRWSELAQHLAAHGVDITLDDVSRLRICDLIQRQVSPNENGAAA